MPLTSPLNRACPARQLKPLLAVVSAMAANPIPDPASKFKRFTAGAILKLVTKERSGGLGLDRGDTIGVGPTVARDGSGVRAGAGIGLEVGVGVGVSDPA